MRRARLIGLTGVLWMVLSAIVSAAETPRPNVVFFLADDLGWSDASVYGSKFHETPNVDRLATRGTRFTNAYAANPLCSPTRASILTGQYPGRLRFTTPAGHLKEEVLDPIVPEKAAPGSKWVLPQTRTRLPLDYYTLAEALRDAGYATAHFGKWHLGWPPYEPERQGFEFNLPGGSYPGPPGGFFAPFPVETLRDSPAGEHIDDRLTRDAIRFLEQHRDRPFFLNYWLFSVHAPFQAKPELIDRYRAKVDPDNPQRSPTMGGMVNTMDACVGRVVEALDRLGLSENTLVIFTSDNGGNMYDLVDGTTPTSNHPLRGGKATIYEGGIRVPLVVVWPGKVAAGATSDAVVSSIDYYPTILEMLGIEPRADVLQDGLSFAPVFTGGKIERSEVFFHFPHAGVAPARFPSTAVRQGDWKLIRAYCDGPEQQDRYELYNLREDLGETNDLAGAMPDKVKEMDALIDRFLKETDSLVPRRNPAYRLAIGGWQGSEQAEIAAAEGLLVVTATGGDPQITTSDVPSVAGRLTLALRMKAAARLEGRAYWLTREHRGPHRDRSTAFDVKHDSEWHEYEMPLDVGAPLLGLRIDPCQAAGRAAIDWIRLRDASGKVIKEWSFDEPAAGR